LVGLVLVFGVGKNRISIAPVCADGDHGVHPAERIRHALRSRVGPPFSVGQVEIFVTSGRHFDFRRPASVSVAFEWRRRRVPSVEITRKEDLVRRNVLQLEVDLSISADLRPGAEGWSGFLAFGFRCLGSHSD
jgi:hypothetical protein